MILHPLNVSARPTGNPDATHFVVSMRALLSPFQNHIADIPNDFEHRGFQTRGKGGKLRLRRLLVGGGARRGGGRNAWGVWGRATQSGCEAKFRTS